MRCVIFTLEVSDGVGMCAFGTGLLRHEKRINPAILMDAVVCVQMAEKSFSAWEMRSRDITVLAQLQPIILGSWRQRIGSLSTDDLQGSNFRIFYYSKVEK